jgi:hypothetical protein
MLLVDLVEKIVCCNWKQEALDRTLWRTGFGTGCGHFALKRENILNELLWSAL